LCATAQTVTKNQNTPNVQASLSVFADQGDLTYCVATAVKGTKPLIQLTCRRSGVTHFTSTYIDSTTFVDHGDVLWMFNFNYGGNPQQVAFQASTNVRDASGQNPVLKSNGFITWPSPTPPSLLQRVINKLKGK
jgi:hypothetical protein